MARPTLRHAPLSERILQLVRARLSVPVITSLLLLPILPASQRNLVFEVLPFWRSLSVLLARESATSSARRRRQLADLQQWLAYWLIYAVLRFCEQTRLAVSRHNRPAFISMHTVKHLVRQSLARIQRQSIPPSISTADVTPSPAAAAVALPYQPVPTLATQIAGTATRWTVVKCILLFYAMDNELQGARWILEKLLKPFASFFKSVDDPADLTWDGTDTSRDRSQRRHRPRSSVTDGVEKTDQSDKDEAVRTSSHLAAYHAPSETSLSAMHPSSQYRHEQHEQLWDQPR